MQKQEISEKGTPRYELTERTSAALSAGLWNSADMRGLASKSESTDISILFGDLIFVGKAISGKAETSKGYIKVYKPENAKVAEKPDITNDSEKNREVPFKSEVVALANTTGTNDNQANWRKIQQERIAAQEYSATDVFLKPGESKVASQKFAIFDDSPEQKQAPQANADLRIAQNIGDLTSPLTLVPSLEQLGITKETTAAAAEIAKQMFKTWTSEHPLKGMEAALMQSTTANNSYAWNDAQAAFPQLKDVSLDLMKAYVLNELNNYGFEDHKQDMAAIAGVDHGWTLGMTQITTEGIHKFENQYPQFHKFLKSKGYTGPGHELKALLDADCVAMIVAAKTASLVDDLKKHHIEHPTNEQLAYAYNPDVYSFSDGRGGKVYQAMYHPNVEISKAQHWDQQKEYYANRPEVLRASAHIHNVMALMHP